MSLLADSDLGDGEADFFLGKLEFGWVEDDAVFCSPAQEVP